MVFPGVPQTIERARLIELIDTPECPEVVLIMAPPGYGKSTLAYQWAAAHPEIGHSWINISAEHLTPAGFSQAIWKAIDHAGGAREPQPAELTDDLLLERLQQQSSPMALIFDNYHRIENDQVQSLVARITGNLPPNVHFMLLSRSIPRISLARLSARGQLRRIGQEDLAFTAHEVEQVFANRGFANELLARLTERARGWITGIQLALLTIDPDSHRSAAQIDRARDSIAANPLLDEYIVEEVLNPLSNDLRRFVLDTAALFDLKPGLCDAVLETETSRSLLRQLEDRLVFVSRSAGIGTPLVYHPLFAECVLQIRERDPHDRTANDLRLRAAEWHRDRGEIEQAARYAIEAEAWPLATELLRACLPGSLAAAYAHTSYDWLRRLPQQYVRDDPVLSSSYLTLMLKSGRYNEARAHFEATARLYESDSDPARAGWRATHHGMFAYMDGDYDEVVRQCEQALSLFPPDVVDGRLFAALGIYRVEDIRGNLKAAHAAFDQIEPWRNKRSPDFSHWYPAILPDLVNSAAIRGDLHGAASMAHHFLADLSGRLSDAATRIRIRLLAIHLEQNRLDLAGELVDDILHHLRMDSYSAWFPRADAILARYFLACGETDRAWNVIDRAMKSARYYGGAAFVRKAETSAVSFWWQTGQHRLAGLLAHRMGIDPHLVQEFGETEPRVLRLQLLIREGKLLDAQEFSERSLRLAHEQKNIAAEIEFLVWSSIILRANERGGEADAALRQALGLGASGGFARVFMPAGFDLTEPISQLAPALDTVTRSYALALIGRSELAAGSGNRSLWVEAGLTDRERDVLEQLVLGKSNREISDSLYITERTVKKHVGNLFRKTGTSNRMAVALWGREQMTEARGSKSRDRPPEFRIRSHSA